MAKFASDKEDGIQKIKPGKEASHHYYMKCDMPLRLGLQKQAELLSNHKMH